MSEALITCLHSPACKTLEEHDLRKENIRITADLSACRQECEELQFKISHAYSFPNGNYYTLEELGQNYTLLESAEAQLTELQAAYNELKTKLEICEDMLAGHK